MLNEFILWLKENEWNVSEYPQKITDASVKQVIPANFPIAGNYIEFLCKIKRCVNRAETTWFVCYDEYSGDSNIAFKWNDFEVLSIDSAGHDDGLVKTIREFWKINVPIIMSVQSGYAYYALRDDGRVVFGMEPEFEEALIIANSFDNFIEMIVNGSISL